MSYTFKRDMLNSNKYSLKAPYSMTPKYITIHNTSNSASAQNEITYMKNNNNATSYHVCVDEKYVIQAIPFNRNAFHAGDGANGTGNRQSIGIEIARSTGDINLFKQAEQNCAMYVAQLLKNYGWGIDRVKRHKDWSGKNCPHRTMELGWTRFLNMIQKELDKLNGKTTTTSSVKVGDKVKVKSTATTYANSTKNIPQWVKNGTYTVSKISGSKVLLKEITSWVNVNDVSKVSTTSTTTTTTTSFNVSDKVVVKSSATTYADSTKIIPSWVKGGLYTISKINGSKVLLKEIVSWVKTSDVQKSGTSSKSVSYVIRVTVDFLNIRSGAGTNFPVTGTVKKGGVYTIVEEKNGFGRLKSGAGWISLDCTKKVK